MNSGKLFRTLTGYNKRLIEYFVDIQSQDEKC
jgi:hypothetical protein